MAYCNSCGKELRENATFCPSCGAAVQTPSQSGLTRKQVLKWGAIGFGGLVVVAIISGGCLLGILSVLKSSGSYHLATQYASENQLIKSEIGEVTGFGFLPQGSISTTGPTGEADLSIGVKGERGDGTLYAKLVKQFGEWKIIEAEFETTTGNRFDLSTGFGQYYKGRILHLNVVALDRAPELLYVHGTKHFRIRPSDENLELVLINVKVENHTATSVIVDIDSQAAEIRDFFQGKYFPINPNDRAKEVDAPSNPADERALVFLWNPTSLDGTSEAFELEKGTGIDGWMVFEVPKETKFREFIWWAEDSLTIPLP